MKISLAIKLLLHCKKSDFNCLNVNKKLIDCYLKKGEYDKITELVNEFKIIDKKDIDVKNVEKELIKMGVKEKESNKEMIYKIAGGVVIAILIATAAKYFVNFVKYTGNEKPTVATAEKGDEGNKINKEEKEDIANNQESNKTEEDNKYTSFPKEELEDNLQKKNIDGLVSVLKKIDENSLAINDRMVYNKAQEYIEKNAVGYYLEKGNLFLDDENYEKALQEYEKGMEYFKKGVWYGEDIVFRLASLNIQLAIVDDASKYCDMLNEYYSDSGYHEDTIYQAAIFMKSRDISKAKEYALKLKQSHPESSYINDEIEEILSE